MQYFIYWLIATAIFYLGYRFGIAVSECKVRYREAEIMELRKLLAYYRDKFWAEVQNNTKLRNSLHETCRN